MQTKIKILLPVIALFMSAVVSAQQSVYTATTNNNRLPEKENSFALSVVADNATPAFRLFVSNPDQKRIGLEISHKLYGVVVDTSFTSGQFNCRYNFEQVNDGRYKITLISVKERITKSVEINTVTTRIAMIE